MKILITGANGQLGQDLQKECEKNEYEYIATDYLANSGSHMAYGKSQNSINTKRPSSQSAKQLHHLDITDFHAVNEVVKRERPRVIINCAAYNNVDKAEKDWETAYSVNGLGVRNIAVAAEKVGVFVIHYSTDYVFDGDKGDTYTIYDDPNPISKYGESKYLGEKLLFKFTNNFALIRTSWVFGSGNINFAKKVLSWAENKKELKLVTDEISVPTYTADLAKATMKIIENNACGIYHITNDGACSRYEYGSYILKKINWQGKIEKATQKDFDLPAKRPKYSKLNNYGLKETIGFEMPHWKDAVDRFLREIGYGL